MMGRGVSVWAIGLALVACKSGGDGAPKSEGAIVASVDRVIAGAASLSTSQVAVKLKLENGKDQGVQITGLEWSIDTGAFAGVLKGQSSPGASLEAQQAAELEFKQDIPLPSEKEAYLAALEEGNILVTVSGSVKLSSGESIAFSRKSSVTTPILPKFIVHDAQAARYGKEGLDVTFFLRLVNENQFPITVTAVEYAVAINGQELKREQGGTGTRLVGGAVQEFEVSVRFDQKSFKDTKAILASQKLNYSVTGQIDLDTLQIPFELPGEINLAAASENEE